MSFNLSKQNLKKILFIGLIVILALFISDAFIKQKQRIDELESTLSPMENKLSFLYSSYPIDYAFEAVEEEPTKENFTLLFHVLINQQRKIEPLIQVNKPQISKEVWIDYSNRPSTQAIMYVNYLLNHVDQIDQEDWDRLDQLKKRWQNFEERTDNLIDSGSGTVKHPTWLASRYTEFIKDLDNIEGIKSRLFNSSMNQ